MCRPLPQHVRPCRPGAASVELAVLLPFLGFMFVIAVDYGWIFNFALTAENAAREGALYGSHDTTHSTDTTGINSNTTLQAGRYIGGIGISSGSITPSPGIYYMDHGGFSVSNGSVTGSGVMIYNDPNPGSGKKFNLSAPTSGTYQGLVVFQARDAGQGPVAITGPGGSQRIGAVYVPSSPVQVTGAGGAIVGSEFIADTLTVTGAGSFTVSWNGAPGLQKRDLRIVE